MRNTDNENQSWLWDRKQGQISHSVLRCILAGVIQLLACVVVYLFKIPNPNIVLFVLLSAALVQYGYGAGIVSGIITFLYSAFFFSADHSWFFIHRSICKS